MDHLRASNFLTSMQELKARAFEMVRFRNIDPGTMDARVHGFLAPLQASLRRAIEDQLRESGPLPPLQLGQLHRNAPTCFVRGDGRRYFPEKDFLKEGSDQSLQVTVFKKTTPEAAELRCEFQKPVSRMPECAFEKMGDLSTPEDCFAALTKLTRKHSGELVVLDELRDEWRLMEVPANFLQWDWGEQFWCLQGGQEVGTTYPASPRRLRENRRADSGLRILRAMMNTSWALTGRNSRAPTMSSWIAFLRHGTI